MTDHTFAITGAIDLNVKLGSGSVVVRCVDDLTHAAVTITPREESSDIADRFTVELRGATLVVHGPRPRGGFFELPMFAAARQHDAVDISVTVPSGTDVKVASLSADVTVHGSAGATDIASGASAIDIEMVDGDARIRFGSGHVTIGAVRGSAQVRAGSSDVTVGDAGGSLDVAFGSGNLLVHTARGPVRMRTGAGSARIGQAEADVDLTSGTGELAIGLREGQNARLDIVTGTGHLNTEMPVQQAPSGKGRAVNIRARTGCGDVTISRAAS